MQDNALEVSHSDNTMEFVPGRLSRVTWVLPALVLIPFFLQYFLQLDSQAAELAVLIAGIVAAALVARYLHQVYQQDRQELEGMRAQAQANCEQRDAAIGTLGNFFSEVLPIWARQIKLAQDHAREEVEVLAQHFGKIVFSLDSAADDKAQENGESSDVVVCEASVIDLSAEERKEIHESLDKILISLQFQDRVNQILEAVGLNLEQIAAHIDQILDSDSEVSLKELLSLTSWLELMQENYTMVEQKMSHYEESISAPSADNNDIEFF